MDKKLLYIIAEGKTDRLALLEPLLNYFHKNFKNIYVNITEGDIAYKSSVNGKNCVDTITNYVDKIEKDYYLFDRDIVAVVQLIDTDGAFIDTNLLKEDKNVLQYEFRRDGIYVNDKERVKERFLKKQCIYNVLIKTETIRSIPYLKFFVSRNLEHAFYDKIDVLDIDKIKLAKSFSDKYKDDDKAFENFLKSITFEVPLYYKESWDYILKDNNSIKRCSNLYLLLKEFDNK